VFVSFSTSTLCNITVSAPSPIQFYSYLCPVSQAHYCICLQKHVIWMPGTTPNWMRSLSYGHLALFVATQVFPSSLLPFNYYSKIGGKHHLEALTEFERRKDYIDMLRDGHPLTILIEQCLDNDPEERPKATAIETQL